jgi:tetratricopeptide (TPR) repeat protein
VSEHSSALQRLQRGWGVLVLPACLAAALYVPSVWHQFVYDDLEIVVRHPLMHTVRTFPELVVSPYWYATGKLYRPLTSLTLGIDWVVATGSPVMSHVVNVLLHAVVTVLVGLLASRWLPRAGAVAAATIFAIHPAHVEAVSTAVGRAELLCAAMLLGLMLLASRTAQATARERAAAAILAALALASKETGVVAPALAFAAASASPTQRAAAWRWAAAALVGVVPMLLVRLIVLGTIGGDAPHPALVVGSWVVRERLALATAVQTLGALLLPHSAPIDVAPTLAQASAPSMVFTAIGLAVVAATCVVVVRHFMRPSVATLAVAIAAFTIAPTANLLFASGVVLAGRTLYSPSIGVALLGGLGVSLAIVAQPLAIRRSAIGVLTCWGVGAVGVSARDLAIWRDSARVSAAMVAREPNNFRAHVYAAELERDRGDMTAALGHYRTAIRLFPSERYLLYSAAVAALAVGDTTSAASWLEDAVTAAPRHWQARTRLAKVEAWRGDTTRARQVLDDGLRLDPGQQTWRAMREQLGR